MALPPSTKGPGGLRFDPPSSDIPGALRWVLMRAFGPREEPAPPPGDGARALELGRATALAALVGSRHELDRLATEVGGRPASAFVLEHGAARRAAGKLLVVVPVLAEVARAADSPLVLLKFAALSVAGYSPPGTRTAGDLDVLVAPEAVEGVVSALRERGLTESGFRDGPHAVALRDGEGRVVDLHRCLPGVSVIEGETSATVVGLEAAGLLEPLAHASPAAGSLVPVRELLAAHAIVHGIAHHGLTPQGYPLFRMVADLVALEASNADPGRVHRWIASDVSEDETRAALALAGRLARGDRSLFDPGPPLTNEAVLLRHLAAALLDGDYARSLRLSWPGSGGMGGVARAAWEAVALTDTQIDVVYGPPRSRWGYVVRRAARPFDLVGRVARYAASAIRVRLRR